MPMLWGEKNSRIIKAELSVNDKLVLLVLFSFADNRTNDCYPSIPTIALWAGLNDRTVQRCLDSLIKREIVQKELRLQKSSKSHKSNMYWIIFENIPLRLVSGRKQTNKGGGHTPPPPGGHTPPITDPLINSTKPELEERKITNYLTLTGESKKSADAELRESEILEAEFWDKEPEAFLIPEKSESVQNTSFASNPTLGEVKISPSCRITETTTGTITGYLAQTEKRYNPALSRLELTELTQTLIDTYNSSKPSSWGTCTRITAFLVKQTEGLLRIYFDHLEINEAVESLRNDIGAAFLSLRGDKFYDNKDFGQKTIGFYLDAKNADRLQKRAQVWYDRPQQVKEQLAHSIANERLNGTPCHLTGVILSDARKCSASRRFKKYLGLPLGDPMREGLPPIEHLQKYYPELKC